MTTAPTQAAAPTTAPAPPRRSAAAIAIAMVAVVMGALVLAGTALGAAVTTANAIAVHTTAKTLGLGTGAAGRIDIDLAAGSLRVAFAPQIEQARLEVTGSRGADGWTLRRDGDTVVIASPQHPFADGWWWGGPGRAVLTLPSDYLSQPVDARIRVSAGTLSASGRFGRLQLTLDAGSATVSGAAEHLVARLSSGAASFDLADVQQADLGLSAGSLTSQFSGAQPQRITATVTAGSLDLVVPRAAYDVRSTVTAGGFANDLGSTPGASSTISVRVSAGQASLRGQ